MGRKTGSPWVAEQERRIATVTVTGETLDKIVEQVTKDFDKFFGEGKWEFLEIQARPFMQVIGGEIVYWEADVEATAVWG